MLGLAGDYPRALDQLWRSRPGFILLGGEVYEGGKLRRALEDAGAGSQPPGDSPPPREHPLQPVALPTAETGTHASSTRSNTSGISPRAMASAS